MFVHAQNRIFHSECIPDFFFCLSIFNKFFCCGQSLHWGVYLDDTIIEGDVVWLNFGKDGGWWNSSRVYIALS